MVADDEAGVELGGKGIGGSVVVMSGGKLVVASELFCDERSDADVKINEALSVASESEEESLEEESVEGEFPEEESTEEEITAEEPLDGRATSDD